MVYGIGTDIIEIDRVKEAVENTRGFLEKTFTEKEIEYFRARKMKYETIAGNFTAKEAVVKAFGTGFIGIEPIDIEVLRDEKGKPYINVLKAGYEDYLINVSISHCRDYSVANVVIEK